MLSDVILVSNCYGGKGEAIELIPYYMIYIYYLQNCKAITFEEIVNHTKYK